MALRPHAILGGVPVALWVSTQMIPQFLPGAGLKAMNRLYPRRREMVEWLTAYDRAMATTDSPALSRARASRR